MKTQLLGWVGRDDLKWLISTFVVFCSTLQLGLALKRWVKKVVLLVYSKEITQTCVFGKHFWDGQFETAQKLCGISEGEFLVDLSSLWTVLHAFVCMSSSRWEFQKGYVGHFVPLSRFWFAVLICAGSDRHLCMFDFSLYLTLEGSFGLAFFCPCGSVKHFATVI